MERNSIILHAQNATALQANIFLKVIKYLLVTSKEGRAFSKPKAVLWSTADFIFTICCSVKSGEIFTEMRKKLVQ
jgi:hypothetical protein